MYSEEEMKKLTVEEQQKLELHEYESIIEAEMKIAEEMPVNGFVRDSRDSADCISNGDGQYWLDGFRTELGTLFFNDDLNDLVNSLARYLREVQFESRELVLQGLAFAKSIVSHTAHSWTPSPECEKNINHWLSGLYSTGDPMGDPMTKEWEDFVDQLQATQFMKNRAEEGMSEENFYRLTEIIGYFISPPDELDTWTADHRFA